MRCQESLLPLSVHRDLVSLFNKVKPENDTSLISLAHAEPFACNFGTNKHIFTFNDKGEFVYGVPPRSILAYLSGTARMAMINLTIVASVPDDELPQVVYYRFSSKTGGNGRVCTQF